MLGQTISHYRILRRLGEGGMGVVFLAEDTRLGRRVALKFPGAAIASDAPVEQSFHTRFLREARALSTLSHKNIATVYDYGETPEGQPFIVMEYVDGTPLNDLLQHRKMTIKRHIEIALAVAEALSAAHDKGIVHRDIKPSNIVLTRAGDVKVLDFGLAKQIASYVNDADPEAKTLPTDGTELRTLSGAIVGTPLYLSPEQAKGATVDGRSDIFALGALLYEMVAGRPAFSGANAIAIGAQIIHVDPPPPSSYNAHVPAELDQIVAHALQKDAAARYQTAAEMNADLRALLAHLEETDDGDVPVRRSVIVVARGKKADSASGSHNGDAVSLPDVSAGSTNSQAGSFAPAHLSSSAFRSINGAVETLRRPRLSLATVLVAALVTLALGWVVVRWWSQPVVREPKPEARRWYDKGAAAMRDGAYFQASKLFARAIAEDDTYALAHARLAEAYTEIDNIDRAKDEMLAVAQLAPDTKQFVPLDAHYLEAVRASVRRDFQKAVAEYQEIVKLKPAEAAAHVDLGRAYEKADDAKRATETYANATKLDKSYATAFLRLGVIQTRQSAKEAEAAFNEAEAIYQAESNAEGRAEVLFQRGVMFDKKGRYGEARASLEKSLQLARVTGNQYQQIAALLRLSSVNYSLGAANQAEPLAREAIALAEANDMQSLTARGLVDLGNTFLSSGDNAEAEQHFARALEIARRARSARNAALALVSLGNVHVQRGALDAGVREIEQALAFYEQGDYRKQVAQAYTLLSRAYRLRGDIDASLRTGERLLAQAEVERDNEQIVYAHSTIGMTLLLAERYAEAHAHFIKQQEAAQSSGDRMNVAYALQSRAEVLWRLGRYAESVSLLDRTTTENPEADAKGLLAAIHLTRAAVLASQLRFNEAIKFGEQAVKLAVATGSESSTVEAKSLLALILMRGGDVRRGAVLCDEATRAAQSLNIPSLMPPLRLIAAEKSLLQGDFADARQLALQTQTDFARSGQLDSEWRAWLLAGRASLRADDREAAREQLARAADTLKRLADAWGAEQFAAYSARPDIALARRQLEDSRQL